MLKGVQGACDRGCPSACLQFKDPHPACLESVPVVPPCMAICTCTRSTILYLNVPLDIQKQVGGLEHAQLCRDKGAKAGVFDRCVGAGQRQEQVSCPGRAQGWIAQGTRA